MGKDSKIEWTDHTFNPWIGCQKVSEGCQFCYAERDFTRKPRWANTWGPPEITERLVTKTWYTPHVWDRRAEDEGMRYKVFCASLADIFEDNPQVAEWRLDLWSLIESTPNLDWLLLTKRPENVLDFVPELWKHGGWPDHVWMGVSVENQERADERIPILLDIPAKVRWISAEPLLGEIDFTYIDGGRIDAITGWQAIDDGHPSGEPRQIEDGPTVNWLIVGGESGPNARPMRHEWVSEILSQCLGRTKFFFKQWGEYNSCGERVGRKKAGSLLDDKEWKQLPDRRNR